MRRERRRTPVAAHTRSASRRDLSPPATSASATVRTRHRQRQISHLRRSLMLFSAIASRLRLKFCGGCGFFREPWDEGTRRALVFAIFIAAAAQRLCFRGGNAGDTEQEIQNQRRRKHTDPAEWRTERENGIANPNQPLEKIIRVTRVLPQSSATRFAGVRGILLEIGKLRVGDRFADHGEEPNTGAEFLEEPERSVGVETSEQERRGQNDIEQRLKFKKEEKAQSEMPFPLFAQLNVAAFFGMPNHSRK